MAWKGKLCGYSNNSTAFRVYNACTRKVVESWNVTFLETPPYSLHLPSVEDDEEEIDYLNDIFNFTAILDDPLDNWSNSMESMEIQRRASEQ